MSQAKASHFICVSHTDAGVQRALRPPAYLGALTGSWVWSGTGGPWTHIHMCCINSLTNGSHALCACERLPLGRKDVKDLWVLHRAPDAWWRSTKKPSRHCGGTWECGCSLWSHDTWWGGCWGSFTSRWELQRPSCLMSMLYAPSPVPSTTQRWTHFILVRTQWQQYHYHSRLWQEDWGLQRPKSFT